MEQRMVRYYLLNGWHATQKWVVLLLLPLLPHDENLAVGVDRMVIVNDPESSSPCPSVLQYNSI